MQKILLIGYLISIAASIFWIARFFWRNRKIPATKCGHMTKIEDWVEAQGKRVKIKVPVENGETQYCHKCLAKMTVPCAWCGKPIFIGSPITLYSPGNENVKIHEGAVLYDKEHNSYVGCLRWECAEIAADRSGFWYPPGEVFRVPSPLEMCLRNIEQGGDGVIIVQDLSRP